MCILCRVRVGTPVLVQLDSGDYTVLLCTQCVDNAYTASPLIKVVIARRLERAQN
jgi:hypothetical protein